MAIDRNSRYPGRFDAPTTARPQGAFKNRSAPNAKDGSYLERDWANDWDGFFGSLLRSAGLTPNGTPDTALSSQYFDALKSLGLRQATESVSGVSKLSTLILALAGTDNATSMTPAKVMAVLIAFLPKRSFSENDYIRIPDVPGGLIIQWGLLSPALDDSYTRITFPVKFPSSVFSAGSTARNASAVTGQNALSSHVGPPDLFGMSIGVSAVSGIGPSPAAYWYAIGN